MVKYELKLFFLLVLVIFLICKWFSIITLKNIYHRAFIFHMLICLDEDNTPIDFGVIWSNDELKEPGMHICRLTCLVRCVC